MAINLTKSIFPYAQQKAVIDAHKSEIDLLRSSKTISEWNENRYIVKTIFGTHKLEYNMLMGYVDTKIFKETFNL